MESEHILNLITKKNELEARWREKVKILKECKSCQEIMQKKVTSKFEQRQMAWKRYEEEFRGMSLVVHNPSNYAAKLDEEIQMIKNGYGFEACSKEHQKIVVEVGVLVRNTIDINKILENAHK